MICRRGGGDFSSLCPIYAPHSRPICIYSPINLRHIHVPSTPPIYTSSRHSLRLYTSMHTPQSTLPFTPHLQPHLHHHLCQIYATIYAHICAPNLRRHPHPNLRPSLSPMKAPSKPIYATVLAQSKSYLRPLRLNPI